MSKNKQNCGKKTMHIHYKIRQCVSDTVLYIEKEIGLLNTRAQVRPPVVKKKFDFLPNCFSSVN